MNRLPSAEHAVATDDKVRDYLLNPRHPNNGGKADQFTRCGFSRDRHDVLATALRMHAMTNEVIDRSTSRHGEKFVVRCHLVTPDGRNPCRTSVWMINHGTTLPRLITAY